MNKTKNLWNEINSFLEILFFISVILLFLYGYYFIFKTFVGGLYKVCILEVNQIYIESTIY